MAFLDILKKKKKELPRDEKKKERPSSPKKVPVKSADTVSLRVDASREGGEVLASILMRPRITEKASFITEDGAYTFDVLPSANKVQIRNAIQEVYGVKPRRVNIISIPPKRVHIRNRAGVVSGGKKAIVYLKKGDRIEFV